MSDSYKKSCSSALPNAFLIAFQMCLLHCLYNYPCDEESRVWKTGPTGGSHHQRCGSTGLDLNHKHRMFLRLLQLPCILMRVDVWVCAHLCGGCGVNPAHRVCSVRRWQQHGGGEGNRRWPSPRVPSTTACQNELFHSLLDTWQPDLHKLQNEDW